MGGQALGVGNLENLLVFVERGVGAAQARVTGCVNALLLVVSNKLGRGVVGVKLDLVDGGNSLVIVSTSSHYSYRRTYLGIWVVEQLLEVLDGKVGNTNVAGLGLGDLLHLSPGVKEVPVRVVLLQVVRVGGRRPVHQVQVNVINAE